MRGKDAALSFAAKHFPNAPEKLVEKLGIEVRLSDAEGCDGWCLQLDDRIIIRISRRLSNSQRRFTLAHELAHLILGIPTMFGESFEEMLASDREEERAVNDVASALLMPVDEVKRDAGSLPVVAAALKRLAKRAKVSELAAAVRVCNLVDDLGLVNASVVSFRDDSLKWQWSRTLQMSNDTAAALLSEARQAEPHAFRADHEQDQMVVASVLENPFFGSSTLFVQLLPREDGRALSTDEKRKQFERSYLNANPDFRNRLSGILGAFKTKCDGLTLEDAVALFWEKERIATRRYRHQFRRGPRIHRATNWAMVRVISTRKHTEIRFANTIDVELCAAGG